MASETPFDVVKVCDCLKKYNEDVSALSLDLYIEAYKELQKFFNCLGTVFSFVTSDVESKINILECYRNDQNCGADYKTLQSMIEYEAKNNLLKSEDRPSGARTLLRLHRALEFISKFILEVSKLEDLAATGPAARSAYQSTLAKYHPWVIRKTASLAMYGLPNREQLIIRAFGGEPGGNKALYTQTMINLAELSETAYNITNKLYEDNNLLDLP
ncbi:ceramide-1-phosphate transfer protein [Tetranychus urticae]|uniref:Glycolipid transfer protein domain-containing protein n=1 Tax=Tetranychus urticae TaxID=32264 RepID=T1JW51_TETUR|nr:ceramide-1-phosphate transfer protein [Tetranychus urticae]